MKAFLHLFLLIASTCASTGIPFVSVGYFPTSGCDDFSTPVRVVYPTGRCLAGNLIFEVTNGQVVVRQHTGGNCTGISWTQASFGDNKCESRIDFRPRGDSERSYEFIKFSSGFTQLPSSDDSVSIAWSDDQCSSFESAYVTYGVGVDPSKDCPQSLISGDVFLFRLLPVTDTTIVNSRTAVVGSYSQGSTRRTLTEVATAEETDAKAESSSTKTEFESTTSVSNGGYTSTIPAGTETRVIQYQRYGPVSSRSTTVSATVPQISAVTAIKSGTFITVSGARTPPTSPPAVTVAELVVSGTLTKEQAQAGLDKIEQKLLNSAYDPNNKRFVVNSVSNLSKRQSKTIISFTVVEKAGATSSTVLITRFQDLVKSEPSTFAAAGLPNPSLTVTTRSSSAVTVSFSFFVLLIGLFM
eukprot:TRINITY_DN4464_c0_g1_i1.p1 TRINITY_DN4464_c0_g1~~TRINITY_DN4464_c0_g1_i1.p1  ORF type:complete len:412 (+),score=65.84 TRINITY_DN4464_c0_g1_i1:42-1277(+)